MPGPLISSAETSALMTTSLGEFPKQTLIAARARVKCGSCPSTSECVARAGSGRWRTWRRWIRTFDSWSRDRQTVMGGGPALETGADLSGNRKFEPISLQRRVSCEPDFLSSDFRKGQVAMARLVTVTRRGGLGP